MDLDEYNTKHGHRQAKWYDDVPQEVLDQVLNSTASGAITARWLKEEHGIEISTSSIVTYRRENK